MKTKLRYFYGTMAAGKTAELLIKAFQFEETGAKVLCLKSSIDDRGEKGKITSRIVPPRDCLLVNPGDDILEIVYKAEDDDNVIYDYIFVDEVQFLDKYQIRQLWKLSHQMYGKNIFCYGVKTSYKNKLFEGVIELLTLADSIAEIKSKCSYCKNKATTHIRYVNDEPVYSGSEFQTGDVYSDDRIIEYYKSVCQDCWHKIIEENDLFWEQSKEGN